MELRHLRYFVAVSEEKSFVHAAQRLRVAQPALSRQIRDLEAEVGATLFERLPRGVRLTPAGEAFLPDARSALADAARAITNARAAAERRTSVLQFAHGELAGYNVTVERLLAAYRCVHPRAQVQVTCQGDGETFDALRDGRVDVACIFAAEWPVAGFGAHRLIDCSVTGVLMPAGHPLAQAPAVRLADLHDLTWLQSGPQRWPGFMTVLERALRERGLVPRRLEERASGMPAANMQIAAGSAWSLVTETVAAPYRGSGSTAIVYRPITEPPIPCWLALVWQEPARPGVQDLVRVAKDMGLASRNPQ
jgi:DNA-binding transcriptional LysR family regulator